MLAIADLMQVDASSRGVINILAAEEARPRRPSIRPFSWLLSPEPFEHQLPEASDRWTNLSSFFFDEATCSSDAGRPGGQSRAGGAPHPFQGRGGFRDPEPLDVPEKNPSDSSATGCSMPCALHPAGTRRRAGGRRDPATNPKFDAAAAITELGVGEALVSFLDEKGTAQRRRAGFIFRRLPVSGRSSVSADERRAVVEGFAAPGHLRPGLADRESAYEALKGKAAQPARPALGSSRPRPARPGLGQRRRASGSAPVRPAPAPEGDAGGGIFGGLGDMFSGAAASAEASSGGGQGVVRYGRHHRPGNRQTGLARRLGFPFSAGGGKINVC